MRLTECERTDSQPMASLIAFLCVIFAVIIVYVVKVICFNLWRTVLTRIMRSRCSTKPTECELKRRLGFVAVLL